MENSELYDLIKKMAAEGILKGTLSQPRYKTYEYNKTSIHLIDEKIRYHQLESFTNEQAFHQNVQGEELVSSLYKIAVNYKQLHIYSEKFERMIRISKKGKVHVTARGLKASITLRQHNKAKSHLLAEGQPVDFLIHLGIMDAQGNIKHKWYDKFKQINRYLESIEDSLKFLDHHHVTIIDFGCGKSNLTFALYYYLVKVKNMSVTIIGLDLKESVIHNLNLLKDDLGYTGLDFRVGDIAMFDYDKPIDMVISLHACNLATDYALEKAVKWQAKVIMAVPCCHKEINAQINPKPMEAVMKHSVLKERIAALMTDGLRAEVLEAAGYDTKVMEFIDMEHTPKNLMIRGIKRDRPPRELSEEYRQCVKEYGLNPTLEKLLS